MSSSMDNNLQTRAIEWHVRLRHGDEATWTAFADWLEQDPRHRVAYEAIEQADLAIEPLLSQVAFPEGLRDTEASGGAPVFRSRRRWLAGGALAASVAAALIVFLPQLGSSRYEVTTSPGQRQTITLDATTQVLLNGSTRMTFDRKNPRFAALASGEALFRVHHDNARPFMLELGNNSRLQDVGTVFDVVRDSSQVRVAVAQGEVIYSAQARETSLGAGQALLAHPDSATVSVITIPVMSVGAWHDGRLIYTGQPMSQVAVDLGRALGVQITVSSAIADRPFSGVIALDGASSGQLERLKVALNVDLVVGPTGWTMKPVDDGNR
jgi:transmembrane sensor